MFLTDPQGDPLRWESDSTLDDASKLLLKAAALIEERGWCQREQESDDGRLCALGALHYADGNRPYDGVSKLGQKARNRLCRAIGTDRVGSQWNDVPGRTKEEVVAKLRAVALGG
jgi:hypothetical protein